MSRIRKDKKEDEKEKTYEELYASENRVTYTTTLHLNDFERQVLEEYTEIYASAYKYAIGNLIKNEKDTTTDSFTLFSSLRAKIASKFDINQRMATSAISHAEGKINSHKSNLKNRIRDIDIKCEKIEKDIETVSDELFFVNPKTYKSYEYKKNGLNWNKSKLPKLLAKKAALEKELETKHYDIVVGTKSLLQKRDSIGKNNCKYSTLKDWEKEWKYSRSNQIAFVGAKSEITGNQNLRMFPDVVKNFGFTDKEKDTIFSFKIEIKLPNKVANKYKQRLIEKYGKKDTLVLYGITFPYGLSHISRVITGNILKENTQSVSYSIRKDENGKTYFSVTLRPEFVEKISSSKNGVIGVDINPDHLDFVETEKYGNPIHSGSLKLSLTGKTSEQSKHIIDKAAKEIAYTAYISEKTIILETLNFARKKATLSCQASKEYSKMLSSFAYNKIQSAIVSSAYKLGVEVQHVSPAWTSVIGRAKFKNVYNLNDHTPAALAIGRRAMQLSEKKPTSNFVNIDVPICRCQCSIRISAGVRGRARWEKVFSDNEQSAIASHYRNCKIYKKLQHEKSRKRGDSSVDRPVAAGVKSVSAPIDIIKLRIILSIILWKTCGFRIFL